jgi:hypothetical protein
MSQRFYHYVGPEPIRRRAIEARGGRRIESPEDLTVWIAENRAMETPDGLVPATFVVGPDGVG